ncbi:epoxyqueuosine reductase QueH [Candidatus Uhrbacteria bacterium]|nr:epoxyqueuosine reductase QueH [Candidatus Uhrbacteria bacterium]
MERLLLHVCCAPCSVAIIEELRSVYGLTAFFYNPNIYPEAEYLKRKAEVIRACGRWNIPLVDQDRENERWEERVSGIPQDREGGSRCSACFRLRIRRTAEYAREHGFGLIATSLTGGRNKRSLVINAIGRAVAEPLGLEFVREDWKRKGRQERGLALVREMGIYRQDYCGCRFSLEDRRKGSEI